MSRPSKADIIAVTIVTAMLVGLAIYIKCADNHIEERLYEKVGAEINKIK